MTKEKTGELVTRDDAGAALAEINQDNPIGVMMHSLLAKADTAEMLTAATATVKELIAAYNMQEDRQARRAFAEDFAALQADLPIVAADSVIPDKYGNVRSTYPKYETIMGAVKPVLSRHGFSVSFTTRREEDRCIAVCTLRHRGGHSEVNEFAARTGSGPPRSSEAQADGAVATYAKRYALCDALNIAVDHDTDARKEGATITQDEADDLRRRVMATNSDEKKFLEFAGADTYEGIRAARHEEALAVLRRKERQQARSPQNNAFTDPDDDAPGFVKEMEADNG